MHNRKGKIVLILLLIVAMIIGGVMIFRIISKLLNKPLEIDAGTGLPVSIKNAEPVAFESFKVQWMGTTAESRVVEAGRTETGAYLEYYLSMERYNSNTSDKEESRCVVRRIEGDEEFYNTLCKLLGAFDVRKWDGFVGKNPSGVLDGHSGSFRAVLSDGSTVYAHGSNNFPTHFTEFYHLLVDMITTETVKTSTVCNDYFAVDVPSEWIGVVKVRYDETMLVFYVTDSKGSDHSFLIFDFNSYLYGDGKFTCLGNLQKTGNDSISYYITVRNNASLPSYYDLLNDEQRKVSDTFSQYEQSVIDSFRGINGYELVTTE